VEARKHTPYVWVVVDADHHLALAATHEVGHSLVVLEWKVNAVAGGLPVRRVHVVEGLGTVVAFSAFKPREVFDVSTGQTLPGGREIFLDPQQVDGRSSSRGAECLPGDLASEGMVLQVFNMAREWGLTSKENPCQGVRKNKETPRDYYANDVVWDAVYKKAAQELKDAMDLAYLTGQRPADVLVMRKDDIEGGYLMVQQNKTHKKLRIQMTASGSENSLGMLIAKIAERNAQHVSSYLIVSARGKRMTAKMLRDRWDTAREKAKKEAIETGDTLLAGRISSFQFRDIRPKAASEITDIGEASLLLGHTKGDITERVYRRVGAIAKPSK
jgi:hypothetical protein